MTDMLSTQDEFDVSDAGVPNIAGAVATITAFEQVEKENGTLHELTFEIAGLSFPITKGFWYTHSNPKAQNAGRSTLKRIAKAASGNTAYNSTSLLNTQVVVDVSEDESGFAQLKKFRAVDGE
jgi:hypothetical protein